MKINDFFRSTFKIALAIFISVVLLSVAGWGVWIVQDLWTKRDAAQYEVIKLWPADLKKYLRLDLHARTKLIEGKLLAEVLIDGYPDYLSDPRLEAKNRDSSFILHFHDKDGFTVYQKSIQIREFSGIVDGEGRKSGLRFQFDEYMSPKEYARLEGLKVEWTLETVLPSSKTPAATADALYLDHCAPNLSKAERLRRLAKRGTLRQTGDGSYSAGSHSIDFFTHDNTLINCR
jgi:hypothetical protein